MSVPRVAVVVPTCRRPALLERCLAALAMQDLCRCQYEVIVSDDAHEAATRRQVCDWARHGLPAHYVQPDVGKGPAAARNAGWRAARAELIAFTDDDCLPEPDWLRRGLEGFVDGVAGLSGSIHMPLPPRPTDYERNAASLERSRFVTANCFYRRAALEAVGGFDERFTLAWLEDTDLRYRLEDAGYRLALAPAARVTHPIRPAPWGVSLRQQRKSMFNALLHKQHPARQHITTPWRYYATAVALLTAGGAAAARRPRLTLAAGAFWAALTARFCARRLRGASRAPSHVVEMAITSALIPPLAIFWRLRGAVKFRVWLL